MNLEIVQSDSPDLYNLKRKDYPEYFAGWSADGAIWISDQSRAEYLDIGGVQLALSHLLK